MIDVYIIDVVENLDYCFLPTDDFTNWLLLAYVSMYITRFAQSLGGRFF